MGDDFFDRAFRPDDACVVLGCGMTFLKGEITCGRLAALKRGRSTVILQSELKRYLESLPRVKLNLDPRPDRFEKVLATQAAQRAAAAAAPAPAKRRPGRPRKPRPEASADAG
jgi:hypothetical protein